MSAGTFGFGYDALSRRTSLTRPNGVNTSYSYDNLSRLVSVLHQRGGSTIDGAAYTVDNVGNRMSRTPQPTGSTSNYAYDAIYQLTGVVQGSTTTESYSYDFVGNRLNSLGMPSYAYNSSNELTSSSNATYGYDANGNTVTRNDSSGITTFAWDYENRLTNVTLPGSGGTVTFKYDPLGRRIYKSSPSAASIFAYDGDNLIEETNATGAVVTRYSQGQSIDEPLAEFRSGGTSYYEADGLGSVTSLSSSTGAVANTYTYDSFGQLTASTGTLSSPFRYTGREFDTETSLYYYRARYYDSQTGRFLSEDPIGSVFGDSNLYPYVGNDPLDRVDPLGLVTCIYRLAYHTLICLSDDGSEWFTTSQVRSGYGPDCVNNRACEPQPGGPIPEGTWYLGAVGNTTIPHSPPRIPIWQKRGTNDYGRGGGFQVHPGRGLFSSTGCLALDPEEYKRFVSFYSRDNRGLLQVRPW
jgi:RHS repeat-associated protein